MWLPGSSRAPNLRVRAPHALADRAHPAVAAGEQGDDAVGLAELVHPQHDRLVTVERHAPMVPPRYDDPLSNAAQTRRSRARAQRAHQQAGHDRDQERGARAVRVGDAADERRTDAVADAEPGDDPGQALGQRGRGHELLDQAERGDQRRRGAQADDERADRQHADVDSRPGTPTAARAKTSACSRKRVEHAAPARCARRRTSPRCRCRRRTAASTAIRSGRGARAGRRTPPSSPRRWRTAHPSPPSPSDEQQDRRGSAAPTGAWPPPTGCGGGSVARWADSHTAPMAISAHATRTARAPGRRASR